MPLVARIVARCSSRPRLSALPLALPNRLAATASASCSSATRVDASTSRRRAVWTFVQPRRSLQPRTLARAIRSAYAAFCQFGSGGSISSSSPFAIVPSVPVTQLPKVSSTICFPIVAPALPPASTTTGANSTVARAAAVSAHPTAPSAASSAPFCAISALRPASNRSNDGSGAWPTKS